jgi:hypothetical protein
VIVLSESISTLSGFSEPDEAPLQEVNIHPLEAVAVSVTTTPLGRMVFVGLRLTVPPPSTETDRVCIAASAESLRRKPRASGKSQRNEHEGFIYNCFQALWDRDYTLRRKARFGKGNFHPMNPIPVRSLFPGTIE